MKKIRPLFLLFVIVNSTCSYGVECDVTDTIDNNNLQIILHNLFFNELSYKVTFDYYGNISETPYWVLNSFNINSNSCSQPSSYIKDKDVLIINSIGFIAEDKTYNAQLNISSIDSKIAIGLISAEQSCELNIIDTHTHINLTDTSVEAALAQIKENNHSQSLLMPPPFLDKNDITHYDYTDEAWRKVSTDNSQFVFVGGGGALNTLIQQATDTDGEVITEKVNELLEQFIAEARKIAEQGSAAFGEMTALHFSLTEGHDYIASKPNHPFFLALADLAAEYKIPIDLHMEAVQTEGLKLPQSVNWEGNPNPKSLSENISGLKALLDYNKNAIISWAHVGWDATGEMTLDLLKELMASHNNLVLQIRGFSNLNGENHPGIRCTEADHDVCTIKDDWLEFMQLYSNRIVIHSDHFYEDGLIGGIDKPKLFEGPRVFINALADRDHDLACKIANKNAKNIYKIP